MDSVFLKNWQFSPHLFNCKKIGRVQLSSNFWLLLALIAIVITLTCEIRTRFLKSILQKWEYYTEGKQDFEKLFIFLNIEMSENRIKLNSARRMWLCGEKNRPSGMSCSNCIQTKIKKTKVWKDFQIFSDWYFRITFCFECEVFFHLTPEILKFQLFLN